MRAIVAAVVLLPFIGGGCSSGKPSGLPIGSTLVEEGFPSMTFTAPQDGRVFVWDQAAHRLVFSTVVKQGQEVWLDVITGKIGVGGKPAKGGSFSSYSRHQIFFLPEGNNGEDNNGRGRMNGRGRRRGR